MKIPQRIIEKAVEGGYLYDGIIPVYEPHVSFSQSGWVVYKEGVLKLSAAVMFEKVVLDKEFWIALGKAEGWRTRQDGPDHWENFAFKFLSAHFAGETEAFWDDLLKTNPT